MNHLSDFINLGCGVRFHPEWVNVNFHATGPHVVACDLSKGIPFPNDSFNVVYHSHLLEHFSKAKAHQFLLECRRILKPDGIIRVVVPDLETIARLYLKYLESAMSGSHPDAANYNWMLLEMYDQAVRTRSGGEMEEYLTQDTVLNEEFIIHRCGVEVQNILNTYKHSRTTGLPQSQLRINSLFARMKRIPRSLREYCIKRLLGDEFEALSIGRFKLSGETHQWMYDRYSLRELLSTCGFMNIKQRGASDSNIADWSRFNLDTNPDGSVYKPDSLYMEAIKS